MKKILTLFTLIFSLTTFGQAQKKADQATNEWKYEIECAGIGADGTYLVKVWSYSKKGQIAITQAKKNAVHGIIFKGFSAGERGCNAQKPIATNPNIESEKADFFAPFFQEGGKYMKYVTESTDGVIDPTDRMKVGKEYKIGVIVSVSKDALRKDLESAGIIRSLTSGF